MNLKEKLIARIVAEGPISVPDYMAACLHDPGFGYYATRPRLGTEGDFITAPLVSQMFGELIGLWAVDVWERLGRPSPFRLIEIGPGDGTLMSDLLRAARIAPEFLNAAQITLVEPSRPLMTLQECRLAEAHPRLAWAEGFAVKDDDPPLILIANEVLDCLPALQFVRTERGWAHRAIGLVDETLAFVVAADVVPEALSPCAAATLPTGAVVEHAPAQATLAWVVASAVARSGGCALLIDYGRERPEPGDTLQALKAHARVDPLACPGEADITMHADFPLVAEWARMAGAEVTPIVTQAAFLRALGIEQRASALQSARPARAEVVARQLDRLIAPDQMGTLFKAIAIHPPGLSVPGFEAAP